MKLVKDNQSAWETYRVEEFPNWGIEKIDRGAWYVFHQWGSQRVYMYAAGAIYGRGIGKEKAIRFLKKKIEDNRGRIIEAVTA